MKDASLIIASLSLAWLAPAPAVEFGKDVLPVLNANCTSCHGGVKQTAGFTFTDPQSPFDPAKSGARPIVPGKPEESELVARITATDADERMPPVGEGEALASEQVRILKDWIAAGARWEQHWAFAPRQAGARPAVADTTWPLNEIDHYVLAKLEAGGIGPSPEADRHTLVRRVALDLTGLPPTLEQVDGFVSDTSPDAYERVVDRFLASPHFGERWARHWLDQARYADSDGYEKDTARPNAWRWRQWVIDSINADQPFDQFTTEQLAGDLIPDARPEQRLATAFHRQTLFNREGGVDPEEDRTKRVIDRATTTSATWLGLTIQCAQCHDHPYDPLKQREFYQFYAFFNNADEANVALPRHREIDFAEMERAIAAARSAAEAEAQAWVEKTPADLAHNAAQQQQTLRQHYFAEVNPITSRLIRDLAESKKRNRINVRVLQQRTENPRPTYIFHRGDFLQPDKDSGSVNSAPPVNAHGFEAGADATRLELARWMVAAENPLTARVIANNIWYHLFGSGLVTTLDDFGTRGQPPSHPRLLDWLAGEFIRDGWSRKQLIKTIVMSRTYRQSSAHRPELAARDTDNRLLHRQNRPRVEAEIVRDLHLSVGGLLSRRIGGASVYPPIPADVAALSYASSAKWQTSQGADRYRRGMYTFFKRTAPDPNLMAFDCPDSNVTLSQRSDSNTPLMALATLQNEVFHEAAQAFAKRILATGGEDDERLTRAFRLALAREPQAAELAVLTGLLDDSRAHYQQDADAARQLAPAGSADMVEAAAWVATLRIITNLDEFITRN